MKPTRTILAALLLAPLAAVAELEKEFVNPPATAKPHTFWYWMGGHISREGLTTDLEAMKRAGIGCAMIFNIAGHGPEGPVKLFSPEWRELMRHAIREAGRVGVEINLNNSMQGWSSSGGPWITPELAMQKLTWSETTIHGGAVFDGVLAQPPTKLGCYRDVAVLAFPTPALESVAEPVASIQSSDASFDPTPLLSRAVAPPDGSPWRDPKAKPVPVVNVPAAQAGRERFIQLNYAKPFAPHWLRIAFAGKGVKGRLEASEDNGRWRLVRNFTPRQSAPVDLALNGAAARQWRVVFSETDAFRLTELVLSSGYRLADWTGKAMFNMYGLDKPPFSEDGEVAPQAGVIRREQIVDLTSKMDAAGRLWWEAPAGAWTVLRLGYTPTGSLAHEGGLECDKLNAAALDVHFQNSLGPWLADKELNPFIHYIHVDSYEKGAQNWTTRLPEEFAKQKGYDLRTYLPVLSGRVVNSVRESERFLWDFRNTVVGLMHENYFVHMQELCRKAGKQFTCEPYHMTQFNNVTAGGHADIPMCEAWMGDGIPGPYWMKLGASPAHVYGKRVVGAEAFTATNRDRSGGKWDTDFWAMKELGDAMLCGGVNRMTFHVYTHQPWMNAAPGQTLGPYGTHFERSNTWWEQMPGFTAYLTRCQYLLQQGTFVADVLYSCGENSPNESLELRGAATLPRGYDYDVCDPHVIFQRLRVQDGRLTLPEGGSYRLLVLPDDSSMTLAMLRRVDELTGAGATVVGRTKPAFSPTLSDNPESAAEFARFADRLWNGGRIISDKTVAEILAACGIHPDVETPPGKPLVRYIHRRLAEGDLYFLASSSVQQQTMDIAFRTADGMPELWDPINGQVRPLPQHRRENGRTIVPLQFEPRQSYFVLFSSRLAPRDAGAENFLTRSVRRTLDGPWEVSFDPKWGGPAKITFPKLEDWTNRPESGIKYYSGKATYRKVFSCQSSVLSCQTFLDLGTVKNVAQVRLNGRDLGIVWCAPWRVEITGIVKPAGNELEIDVVNLWPNRMIGDEQLPADCEYSTGVWILLKRLPDWFVKGEPRTSGRYTFSIHQPWTKDSPLLESGLLGPVTLQAAGKTNIERMHTP
ncbi:MAG: hypothetical protein FJ395_09405 [Verrucomicrobia bacterium]|nr:hypothetical protein [Verrucomicrobiota bacterium]